MTQPPRFISSKEFIEALVTVGVLDGIRGIRRVVIDANGRNAVIMYVERFGDERLLHVGLPWDGIEVREVASIPPNDGAT